MKRAVLGTLLFILAVAGFTCVPSAIRKVLLVPNGAVLTNTDNDQVTPGGAHVTGKFKVSSAQLALVDEGLTRAIGNAKLSGYTDTRSQAVSFYQISTPPYSCVPSPEQRIPSFMLHADQYDGTIYDQYNPQGKETDPVAIAQGFVNKRDGKGVIYAAEMVLSLGTPGSQPEHGWMYACPDASVIADAANNGAEHIEIANSDPDYYWATQFHALGGHPLLPHQTSSGLARGMPKPVSIVEVDDGFAVSAGSKVTVSNAVSIEPVR